MYDKSKEIQTSLHLINDKLNFEGVVGENKPLSIDYIPPLGDNLGYTSLELLLLSLTSCLGTAVLTFLRKMNKTIQSFDVQAKGIRKEEHPTGFRTIYIEINLKSPDIVDVDVAKVVKLAEDTYCPVWSMLNKDVEIEVSYRILN